MKLVDVGLGSTMHFKRFDREHARACLMHAHAHADRYTQHKGYGTAPGDVVVGGTDERKQTLHL